MSWQWQWVWDFEDRAEIAGDVARVRLAELRILAEETSDDLPDEKLELYRAGRDLAIQLSEPWWELFYEHWIIEILLYGKNQPEAALKHATSAVLRASAPQFDAFPQRLLLQINLAVAYSALDPIGYENELRALFALIKTNCGDDAEFRAYHKQSYGYFLESLEDKDGLDVAYEYLWRADKLESDHYIQDALNMMCSMLYLLDRGAARIQIGELAERGETAARREKANSSTAMFLMWRAVAARWDGQEREAQRFYRRAMMLQKRLPPPRNSVHYGAIAFHEEGGDYEGALRICQSEIRILQAHELSFPLAKSRLEKCRLLKQLGRDFSREAKRLRRVAAKLKSQAHWEAKLAALEASPGNA